MQEPEPLLCKGKDGMAVAFGTTNWPGDGGGGLSGACADRRGKAGNGWRLEQIGNGQFQVQQLAQAAHDLHRMQRMGSEVEEVVVDANLVQMQNGAPDVSD